MNLCETSITPKIIIFQSKKVCRYHRGSKKSYVGNKEITSGLCPYAFYVLYAFALALLYDSEKDLFQVSCSGGKVFSIKRVKALPKFIPTMIRECILNRIGGFKIIFEALDSCEAHHKGERVSLNVRDPNVLCPASAYTLYPFLLAKVKTKINCPDHEGVIYEIV